MFEVSTITVNNWDWQLFTCWDEHCRLGFSFLQHVLASPCVSRCKALRRICSTFHVEARNSIQWFLRQEAQWYQCKPIYNGAAGWICISLDQKFKAEIILFEISFWIATQNTSFLLYFAIYWAPDWLYTKPGLGWNGELNKPTRLWIIKCLRGDKAVSVSHTALCSTLWWFHRLLEVNNSDFSGKSNINFCCCSNLPWIREWKVVLVWSGTGYLVKISNEQPGCSGGSKCDSSTSCVATQDCPAVLLFHRPFASSFPSLNNTNLILVLFSCKFFLVVSTSILLVKQHWHPFTQGAFKGSLHGLGAHREVSCSS